MSKPPTYTELTHQMNTTLDNLRLLKDYEHDLETQRAGVDDDLVEEARLGFESSMLRMREMLLKATRHYK